MFDPAEAAPGEEAAPAPLRKAAQVKADLLKLVNSLTSNEKRPCGIDGRSETDAPLIKLTSELEAIFRERFDDDFEEFDTDELHGEWELIYSTSNKFRRWCSVFNGEKDIKDAEFDGLVQSFSRSGDEMATLEYDMEEILQLQGGKGEYSARGAGTWQVAIQQNVVSGKEDLVLKITLQNAEFESPDGEVTQPGTKVLDSQMVRTFCYSFISYVDADLRVGRTGLTANSVFIFQRLKDEEA